MYFFQISIFHEECDCVYFMTNFCTPKCNSLHLQPKFEKVSEITPRKLQLKETRRLTKAIAEMKPDTEQTMNWSSCTKLALSASRTHGLIAQSVRASERNSVVVGSNPTQVNCI